MNSMGGSNLHLGWATMQAAASLTLNSRVGNHTMGNHHRIF